GALAQAVWQGLHVSDFSFDVVGILIVPSISKSFHQPCGSVAELKWNRLGSGALDIFKNSTVSGIQSVGLRCNIQVHHGLTEREIAFRHADKIHSIASRHAQGES